MQVHHSLIPSIISNSSSRKTEKMRIEMELISPVNAVEAEKEEIRDFKAQVLNERLQLSVDSVAALSRAVDSGISSYFSSFGELVNSQCDVNQEEDYATKSLLRLSMLFDEELFQMRKSYEERIRSCFEDQREKEEIMRQQVYADETKELERLYTASRKTVLEEIASHDDRMNASASASESRIEADLVQLRSLQVELSTLERSVEKNGKLLNSLSDKNQKLRAPVMALTQEVSSMEAKVLEYKNATRPELERIKSITKKLQQDIREKSFRLECLTQKVLILEERRDKTSVVLDALSIADTTDTCCM